MSYEFYAAGASKNVTCSNNFYYNTLKSRVSTLTASKGVSYRRANFVPQTYGLSIIQSVTVFISLSWSRFVGFLFHSKPNDQIILFRLGTRGRKYYR